MSNGLPEWIKDIVDDFVDRLNSTHELLGICITGMNSLEFIPAMIKAFEEESSNYESKLRNAQMAINLWSSLRSIYTKLTYSLAKKYT